MTSQCPRCLSSSFPLLSNGRCTFCIGHFRSGKRLPWPNDSHVKVVTRHDIEEPRLPPQPGKLQ